MYEGLDQQIDEIYQKYHQDVFYFLIYFLGDQNEAEDAAQDVFIKLLKSLPKYDGRVAMKTWLFSIAKHVAIDKWRRKKFEAIFSEEYFRRLISKVGLPEEELEKKEDEQELKAAIQKLPPKYRIVIILRSLKKQSVRETAELLAISEEKVRVDHYRGLKLLKKYLLKQKGRGEATCIG